MTPDAVADKQTLGPWWVVASAAAAAVGIAAGRPLAELVREPFSQIVGGLPTVAIFGAFFGLCLGLAHALARRRMVPAVEWTLASTLGGAVGYVLGVMLAALITDPLRGQVIVYVSEVLGYLVFGAAVGVLLGLTQWTIWRTRGSRRVAGIAGVVGWTVLSALGWALGFTVTAGVGLELTRFPSVTVRDVIFGGFAGLIAGGMQALVAAWRNGRR
jgi:hypothetical protein